jgi:hypothetical protein
VVRLSTVGFTVVSLCLKEPCVALLWLGDSSYVMCTALYMMVLYDRARVGPTTKLSDKISIICLFPAYSASQILYFVLSCGIRVASLSSVDSIPFPKRCSHIFMGVLILLDHRDCHFNSFPTGVLLFKLILSFQYLLDQFSVLRNRVCFIRPKLPLFSHHPTLFLQGLGFLNPVSILLMSSLSILFLQCS